MNGEIEQPMVDVEGLLAKVQAQQDEVMRIQKGVEAMLVKGRSRNNEVEVTVRGNGRFTEINIDPETVRRFDHHELGDIVLEAVNDGLQKLSQASSARFAPIIEAASRIEPPR
jgi:nucleoid-associated protein EbfC